MTRARIDIVRRWRRTRVMTTSLQCCTGRTEAMLEAMNKPVGGDDSRIGNTSAELIKDVAEAGGHLDDSPALVEMIRAQAQRAIDHPEEAIPGDQFFAWLDKLRASARRT